MKNQYFKRMINKRDSAAAASALESAAAALPSSVEPAFYRFQSRAAPDQIYDYRN